jgi:hypothetical protein
MGWGSEIRDPEKTYSGSSHVKSHALWCGCESSYGIIWENIGIPSDAKMSIFVQMCTGIYLSVNFNLKISEYCVFVFMANMAIVKELPDWRLKAGSEIPYT